MVYCFVSNLKLRPNNKNIYICVFISGGNTLIQCSYCSISFKHCLVVVRLPAQYSSGSDGELSGILKNDAVSFERD